MKEITLIKIDDGLKPQTETAKQILNQYAAGEVVAVSIPNAKPRSLQQLNLYFALCEFVAHNMDDQNFNTKDKVNEQCKIHLRHVDTWYYYINEKTGEKTLNIKTKSISFTELDHLEACNYFDDAFKYFAELLNVELDELILNCKAQMVVEKFKGELV